MLFCIIVGRRIENCDISYRFFFFLFFSGHEEKWHVATVAFLVLNELLTSGSPLLGLSIVPNVVH